MPYIKNQSESSNRETVSRTVGVKDWVEATRGVSVLGYTGESMSETISGGVVILSSDDESAEKSEEFNRFEDLTRKLLSVPKSEIDAERQDTK